MKKSRVSKPVAPWEVTESMFLSEQEVDELCKFLHESEQRSTPDERTRALVDRLIIEILLFSGLRNSELCRLSIDDTEAVHGKPLINVVESSSETRSVYLPSSLSRELVSFIQGARREFVPIGQLPCDESNTLILNERGRPYDRTSLYRRVVRILTAAGLGDRASVQLLRHTYGFLAYKRSNGNLLFVQQQLGHAHPMVTAVYAQFVKFSYSELADDIGRQALASNAQRLNESKNQSQLRKAKK